MRLGAAALLVTAACSLEVNINTRSDEDAKPSSSPIREIAIPAPTRATDPRVGAAPIGRPDTPVIVDQTVTQAPRPDDIAATPVFTPFTVAPSIQNRDEVVAEMVAEYPPLLREAGIGGTVKVYFFIDADGRVQDTRIDQSSGHQALDDAALRVAKVYRFDPALNRDEKVPVWVSFPISFQVKR
jgi:protein TonB